MADSPVVILRPAVLLLHRRHLLRSLHTRYGRYTHVTVVTHTLRSLPRSLLTRNGCNTQVTISAINTLQICPCVTSAVAQGLQQQHFVAHKTPTPTTLNSSTVFVVHTSLITILNTSTTFCSHNINSNTKHQQHFFAHTTSTITLNTSTILLLTQHQQL